MIADNNNAEKFIHLKRLTLIKISTYLAVLLGIATIALSLFFDSYFLTIFGIALLFWSIILYYITPTKQIPIIFLEESVTAHIENIERIIQEYNLEHKGVYLPPKNLKKVESSLIFFPKSSNLVDLPNPEEITNKLYSIQREGIFLVPPGFGIMRSIESVLHISFLKIDIQNLQIMLPKIIVEQFELAEDMDISLENDKVNMRIIGSVFSSVLKQTDNKSLTQNQVGSPLSSALACILAKVLDCPIIFENETINFDKKEQILTFTVLEQQS
jgi:hypothetical protein